MAEERASIFGDDDPDISSFIPKPPTPAARPEQVRAVSEVANFRSREPKPAPAKKPAARTPRQYRTGRNMQLNIKVRAEAVEAFYALADRQNWVLGETFERAVEALGRELASDDAASRPSSRSGNE
jgi:hypothetical protein